MAKGWSMEEFRQQLSSEATEENERLNKEIVDLKAAIREKNEEISSLKEKLKEVEHHCQSLGNRCFVFSKGLMCTYCGCGELCPHGLTDEEYHAIAVFMKKNHLSHTDESREKVNEFIVNRRLEATKREFDKEI